MGKKVFSRVAYKKSVLSFAPEDGSVTKMAEQEAKETGKLNPLVDPAEYGVIRPSRPRFVQQEDGTWLLTVGTPAPIETRVDTTGSMGNNVDIALRVLPDAYELCSGVLPGYDLQLATGIFGDVQDNFVLCRPQFEAHAEKIVEQLTFMVPEHGGGDPDEDPHYGLFGGAYLTDFYINRIGLKGYDFTVSDARARDKLNENELIRIFGEQVFEKVKENGHQLDSNDLPSTEEVVQDLLKRSHAFFLQVGDSSSTNSFWVSIFGQDRVVLLPSTEFLPHVQAAIIGLTEGTLELGTVQEFLEKNNVKTEIAERIVKSVANIPIGEQVALPNFPKRPQKGDIFAEKTSLWPMDKSEIDSDLVKGSEEDSPGWI